MSEYDSDSESNNGDDAGKMSQSDSSDDDGIPAQAKANVEPAPQVQPAPTDILDNSTRPNAKDSRPNRSRGLKRTRSLSRPLLTKTLPLVWPTMAKNTPTLTSYASK